MPYPVAVPYMSDHGRFSGNGIFFGQNSIRTAEWYQEVSMQLKWRAHAPPDLFCTIQMFLAMNTFDHIIFKSKVESRGSKTGTRSKVYGLKGCLLQLCGVCQISSV
ncbi:MAG TPA: hypothetical protein VMZ69_00260 [Saprospiraceae bacterium]|nr:hypothetical protein [Saprospiraceae bacterium]